jgi:hypothetical protein
VVCQTITLTQTSVPLWRLHEPTRLPPTFHVGGSRTSLKDTSKKPSGWTKNMAGDTILPATIQTMTILLMPLILTSELFSGELLDDFLTTEDLQSSDLHPLNWASISMTKKELIEAVGDHWTDRRKKKKSSPETSSSLEVTKKKLQTKTSKSLSQMQQQLLMLQFTDRTA